MGVLPVIAARHARCNGSAANCRKLAANGSAVHRWLQGQRMAAKRLKSLETPLIIASMSKGTPMRKLLTIAASITLALGAIPAAAQKPAAAPLLVDVDWVSQHLNDRNLVLLHVGGPFASQHIPGARQVS